MKNMKKQMKNFKVIFLGMVLSTLTAACGNMTASKNSVGFSPNELNAYYSQGSSNPYLSAAEKCSETPNVLGQTRTTLSAQYQVCASGPNGVKVFSYDTTSRSICIFPVQNVNGRKVATTVNINASTYLSRYAYQCLNTNPVSGGVANFSGITFNSIFVVNQEDAPVFAACLAYGDVASCSAQVSINYSFGQFQ